MEPSELASRLNARPSGKNRWVAKCPAHEDKSPSLTISEGNDGRVLLHCFAGCGVGDITGAMGIDLSELFPKSLVGSKPSRSQFSPWDVLRLLSVEATIVMVSARQVARGSALSDPDHARLLLAAGRIHDAMEVLAS